MNTGGRWTWDMLYVPLTGSLVGVHLADAGTLGLQSWGQISTQQVWWTLADAVKGSGHQQLRYQPKLNHVGKGLMLV